jgi:probable rRNA maturation factor
MEFPALHEEAFGNEELYLHLQDVSIDLPDAEKLLEVIKLMAKTEKKPFRELNYIFCSDDFLLEMNRTHLDHDYYTDVITFPHLDHAICGDVYISTDRIAENAKKLGITFDFELLRVILHGALHLAGYADTTPELKQKMSQREDHYLAIYG